MAFGATTHLANAREGVKLHPDDGDVAAYRELERHGLVTIARPERCTFIPGPKSGTRCKGCAKCDGWLHVELTDRGKATLGNSP